MLGCVFFERWGKKDKAGCGARVFWPNPPSTKSDKEINVFLKVWMYLLEQRTEGAAYYLWICRVGSEPYVSDLKQYTVHQQV